MKAKKESSKERKESKESKKSVVVAEALKTTTTTNAGAREYPVDQPLEVVTKADLQYFVEIFNGEICRMQAAIPAIDTLDRVCRHQLSVLLHKYPMAKLEKMATMATHGAPAPHRLGPHHLRGDRAAVSPSPRPLPRRAGG